MLERFVLLPLQSRDETYHETNEEGSNEDHRESKVVCSDRAANWTLRIHRFVPLEVVRLGVKELRTTACELLLVRVLLTVLVVVSQRVRILLTIGWEAIEHFYYYIFLFGYPNTGVLGFWGDRKSVV